MNGLIGDFLKLRRFPHRTLPPIQEDHRGQMVMASGDDSTTDDEFYVGASEAGTLEWRKLVSAEHMAYLATFGPFYTSDLAASATVALEAPFFNTATAVSRSTPDVHMPLAGEVVGMFVIVDANRASGNASVRPVVNGVAQAFAGGGTCVIDNTNPRRHSVVVDAGEGSAFTPGQRVALQVVTTGWAPLTANMTAWMLVKFDR